ncbi:MAG: hypothetical protein AAFM92_03295 [Pseudomonadota bacterium]
MARPNQVEAPDWVGDVIIQWPWQAQVSVAVLAGLILAMWIFLRAPKASAKPSAPAVSSTADPVAALAASLMQSSEMAAHAKAEAEEAQRLLRQICMMILQDPSPDMDRLRATARTALEKLNER